MSQENVETIVRLGAPLLPGAQDAAAALLLLPL
jgi:hypothetical protein